MAGFLTIRSLRAHAAPCARAPCAPWDDAAPPSRALAAQWHADSDGHVVCGWTQIERNAPEPSG